MYKKIGKASSVVSDSVFSKESFPKELIKRPESPTANLVHVKQLAKIYEPNNDDAAADQGKDNLPSPTIGKPQKINGAEETKVLSPINVVDPTKAVEPEQKYVIGAPFLKKGHPVYADSEVGPSASEVAAAMIVERRYPLDNVDKESSLLDGWSMDESVEGLRSKLDRWRMELPPLYDRTGAGAGEDFSGSSYKSTSSYRSRKTNTDKDGLFSCFGNIFGYECQCICGKPPGGQKRRLTSPASSPDKSSLL